MTAILRRAVVVGLTLATLLAVTGSVAPATVQTVAVAAQTHV